MKPDYSLYLIFDPSAFPQEQIKLFLTEAILGGVSIVQLRMKHAAHEELLAWGKSIKTILDRYHIPLIINDNVLAAKQIQAHGAHIGQNDMPYHEARAILGPDACIGLSVGSIQEASAALHLDADYLGIGPVFATATKLDTPFPIGCEVISQVRRMTGKPLIAIGGLNANNIGQVMSLGVDGIALASALHCPQPRSMAGRLKQLILEAKNDMHTRS